MAVTALGEAQIVRMFLARFSLSVVLGTAVPFFLWKTHSLYLRGRIRLWYSEKMREFKDLQDVDAWLGPMDYLGFEEYEIQFIDGEAIDCDLAKAIGINQANLAQYFDAVDAWSDDQKQRVIIAVGERGYDFVADTNPDDFEIDIYEVESFEDLAEQFVADGLFGSLGDLPIYYVDYESIARDLRADYSEVTIAGKTLIYRCG